MKVSIHCSVWSMFVGQCFLSLFKKMNFNCFMICYYASYCFPFQTFFLSLCGSVVVLFVLVSAICDSFYIIYDKKDKQKEMEWGHCDVFL